MNALSQSLKMNIPIKLMKGNRMNVTNTNIPLEELELKAEIAYWIKEVEKELVIINRRRREFRKRTELEGRLRWLKGSQEATWVALDHSRTNK